MENVKETFGLSEKTCRLFENTEALPFSDWLKEALDIGLHLAFASSSEKARSEFIVVPILFELQKSCLQHTIRFVNNIKRQLKATFRNVNIAVNQ